MPVLSTIKQKIDDALEDYVFNLLNLRLDTIPDEDLLELLTAYQGPVNLLRSLREELSAYQKDTIARAFVTVIENIELDDAELSIREEGVLNLVDPYIRYSSEKFRAFDVLRALALELRKRQARDEIIIVVHVALLDLDVTSFQSEYWCELHRERGDAVAAVTLSGLRDTSIEATFKWLSEQFISDQLAELLTVHLPSLNQRAPEQTSKRLSALLVSGRWSADAKNRIREFCREIGIRIHTRIGVEINMPELAPTLARILEGPSEDAVGSFSEAILGTRLAQREVREGNGLAETRAAITEYVNGTARQSGNFEPAVRVLRARSNYLWRTLVSEPNLKDLRFHLLTTFLDEVDFGGIRQKLVAECKSAKIKQLVFEYSEYHEDRVISQFLAALMEMCGGPQIILEKTDWLKPLDNKSKKRIVIKIAPRILTRTAATSDPDILYGFRGYFVFARRAWLRKALDDLVGQDVAIGNMPLNGSTLGSRLAKISLEAKAWLAVKGGVLHSGVGHSHPGLREYLLRVAERHPQYVPPQERFLEPLSGRVFSEFLTTGHKDEREVLLAGGVYSELLIDWFLEYDFGFEILLGPKDLTNILRHSGESDLDFFDAVEIANSRQAPWEGLLMTLLGKIALYFDHLCKLDSSKAHEEENGRTRLSDNENRLVQAWRSYAFSILGADEDIKFLDHRYWAFASDASSSTKPFREFNDFTVHIVSRSPEQRARLRLVKE